MISEDGHSTGMHETVYSAGSSFGLKEFLVQNSPKSKLPQITMFTTELEELLGPSNVRVLPADRYSERPRLSLEDDAHKRKWCNGRCVANSSRSNFD